MVIVDKETDRLNKKQFRKNGHFVSDTGVLF